MFLDLDPTRRPAKARITDHSVIKNLFEGVKASGVTFPDEYPIDDEGLKMPVPRLFYDADSSQHSALIHALNGKNLVIEGPPGTGKSQSFTNLIAAALLKGKSVLFIAEKLAALEVVYGRLDAIGFPFTSYLRSMRSSILDTNLGVWLFISCSIPGLNSCHRFMPASLPTVEPKSPNGSPTDRLQ